MHTLSLGQSVPTNRSLVCVLQLTGPPDVQLLVRAGSIIIAATSAPQLVVLLLLGGVLQLLLGVPTPGLWAARQRQVGACLGTVGARPLAVLLLCADVA
jgi:hypothetical protein